MSGSQSRSPPRTQLLLLPLVRRLLHHLLATGPLEQVVIAGAPAKPQLEEEGRHESCRIVRCIPACDEGCCMARRGSVGRQEYREGREDNLGMRNRLCMLYRK